jgi:Ligand-gated ion channel
VLWLVEHRHNDHFGVHRRGFGSSVWWSAVAMTQCGYAAGEKVPVTLPGRLIAVVWMVASVIVIASFTAALMSQLTLKQLRGTVHGEADLRYVCVAVVAGTVTIEYLNNRHVAYQIFADADAGLSALPAGQGRCIGVRPASAIAVSQRALLRLTAGAGRDLRFKGLCDRATTGKRTTVGKRPWPARRRSD